MSVPKSKPPQIVCRTCNKTFDNKAAATAHIGEFSNCATRDADRAELIDNKLNDVLTLAAETLHDVVADGSVTVKELDLALKPDPTLRSIWRDVFDLNDPITAAAHGIAATCDPEVQEVPLSRIVLVYSDGKGQQHAQPLTDVYEVGTLVDPDTDDDLEPEFAIVNPVEPQQGSAS